MDQQNSTNTRDVALEDKFRIEDTAVQLLIQKLQTQSVKPEYAGHIAQKVLEIVSQSHSRSEMAELIEHNEKEYPELHSITEHEAVYVKEQAEDIIKQTVEDLIVAKQTETALSLAKTINDGTIPAEIQEKIDKI